jgi:uncharacterized RDD family membrane protein YckC
MNPRDPTHPAAPTVPPEARVHQGHVAGIVSRLIAAGVDLVLVTCLLVAAYGGWCVGLFILQTKTFTFPRPSLLLIVIAYEVVAISYLAIAWWVSGRSYGQHVMGLRVTTQRGQRLRFLHALLRSAVCITFPIGLFWVVVSRRSAAVHDVLLHTSVNYDWTT